MKILKIVLLTLFGSIMWLSVTSAMAQDEVEIETQHLRGNIYVLFGRGGNIGVSAGEEGVFFVDDQFAPLTPKVISAVRAISDAPIQFVLNTHYHGDHTGGNENLGKEGAVILAHDNVRPRMIAEPREGAKLPVLTFNDQVSIYINGEEARAIHVKHAHTDGDSIIWFKDSNVIHMGDTFFYERYPFIDVDGGGDIDGLIDAASYVLSIIDDETLIIPGHGSVTDKTGLQAYLDLLTTSRERVKALKDKGATLEEVLAANVTAAYDEKWTWGFINAERFVTPIYNSVD